MTPSIRRCILAVVMVGGIVPSMEAVAQQTGASSAQQTAPAKAAPAKAVAKKKADPKAPKADPAAAQGQVEDGVNALAQGRADAAVASLTSALSASSLPQNQTARALYYRGVAYRRQAKPAQAISDLTNALWIKGGLTEEQRQDALLQRSGAYREAGLPDQGDQGSQRAVTGTKAGAQSAPFATVAPPAPNGSSTTMTAGGGSIFGSLFGGSAPTPPTQAPPRSVANAPVTTASVAPAQPNPATSRTVVPTPTGSVSSENKPATRMVPVLNSASSLPSGFQEIGDSVRMVEVSTSARAGQQAGAAAQAVAPVPEPKGKAVASSASRGAAKEAAKPQSPVQSQPTVAPAAAPQRVASAPQAVASAGSAGRVSDGGPVPAPRAGAAGVRIQVAAVRTAEEAQGVSAKLQAQYARELGGRAPVVDQVSAGNFGSFYRVQVGPFAPTRETEELCAKLKTGGLDCRLVSQ